MNSYAGDIFIDFPNLYQDYMEKGKCELLVAETHADMFNRFDFGENHTREQQVECCRRSLGLDFIITITPDETIIEYYGDDKWFLWRVEQDWKSYGYGELEIKKVE